MPWIARQLLVILFLCYLSNANLLAGSDGARPNVIFIKTDDQRFDSLSMTGHPVTKTPHIDRLADEGVFFSQAFITSPICGPSRANFFSGQWERKNRVGFSSMSKNPMTTEVFDQSWLMRLKAAGYFTGYIGKHHVSIGPIRERSRYMIENIDFCYMRAGHLGFNLHKKEQFQNLKNSSQIEGLYEATEAFFSSEGDKDYFFENAHESFKDFLKRRDASRPFALSINFNLPHEASIGGMGAQPSDPEMYRSLYEDLKDQQPLPIAYPNPVSLPEAVFRQDELMSYYQNLQEHRLVRKMTRMSRAVTGIDNFVGQLRGDLEELGISENTILVFASDHGLLLGEHGLGGKTFLYEESIHVPMIFHSPYFAGDQVGRVVDELVVGQDLPATILELCGLAVPESYQGVSLLPLINGEPVQWRQDVFCENLFTDQGYPRMEAVRGKKYKYIRYFSKEHDRMQYLPFSSIEGEQPIYEELFDLEADPKEQTNLTSNPDYAAVLKKHRYRCQELVTELAN